MRSDRITNQQCVATERGFRPKALQGCFGLALPCLGNLRREHDRRVVPNGDHLSGAKPNQCAAFVCVVAHGPRGMLYARCQLSRAQMQRTVSNPHDLSSVASAGAFKILRERCAVRCIQHTTHNTRVQDLARALRSSSAAAAAFPPAMSDGREPYCDQ